MYPNCKVDPTGSMPVLGYEYRILQLDRSRLQQAERATEESQTACSVPDTEPLCQAGQAAISYSAGQISSGKSCTTGWLLAIISPFPVPPLQLFGKLQKQRSSLPSWLVFLEELLDMQQLVVDPLSQGRDMMAGV